MGWLDVAIVLLRDWRIQLLVGSIIIAIVLALVLTFIELRVKKKKETTTYQEKKQLFFAKFHQQVQSAKTVREKIDVIDRVAKAYFRDVFDMNTKKDYLSLIADFKAREQKELAHFCKIMFEYYYSPKDVSESDVEAILNVFLGIIASLDEHWIKEHNKDFYARVNTERSSDSSEEENESLESSEEPLEHVERFLPEGAVVPKYDEPSRVLLDEKAKSLLEEVEAVVPKQDYPVLSEQPVESSPQETSSSTGVLQKLKEIRDAIRGRAAKNRELRSVLRREKELHKKLIHEEKKRQKLLVLEQDRKKREEALALEQKRKKEEDALRLEEVRRKILEAEKAYKMVPRPVAPTKNVTSFRNFIDKGKDLVVSLGNLRNYSLVIQRESEMDKREMELWQKYSVEQLKTLRDSLKGDFERLKQFIKDSQGSEIYFCVQCNKEVSERVATEENFTCKTCGQFYVPVESKVFLIDSRRKVLRLRRALLFVEGRLSALSGDTIKRGVFEKKEKEQEQLFVRENEMLDLERQEWLKGLALKREGMKEEANR